MKKASPILQQAETHVFALLRDRLPSHFVFHNFSFTAAVAGAVGELAEAEHLDRESTEQLLLAAWFLYTGYTEGTADFAGHSARLASAFLRDQMAPEPFTDRVASLITGALAPTAPATVAEAILRDARRFWLAKKSVGERLHLLFREQAPEGVDETGWILQHILQYSQERYHTLTAAQWWEHRKTLNLLRLSRQLKERRGQEDASSDQPVGIGEQAEPNDNQERRILQNTALVLLVLSVVVAGGAMWLFFFAEGLSKAAGGILLASGGVICLMLSVAALWPLSFSGLHDRATRERFANRPTGRHENMMLRRQRHLTWQRRMVRMCLVTLLFTLVLFLLMASGAALLSQAGQW
ncbi:MAG: hypothetical protein RMK52_01240 [Chitinophagales bacterium]|nr:hypothetical protein [Chitinophagales bacterium]MDW8392850.1 hypothetical protein [Chitinophagales bacterium]